MEGLCYSIFISREQRSEIFQKSEINARVLWITTTNGVDIHNSIVNIF